MIINENEKITVRLADGREFVVDFWPYTNRMLAISIQGDVPSDTNCRFVIDVAIDPETELVYGPDLPKD